MENSHSPNGVNGALDSKTPLTTTSNRTQENATVDGSTDPVLTPILYPASTHIPPPSKPLTPDQQTKYTSLLTAAKSWTVLPTTAKSAQPIAPLTDSERMWLTRECLLRYLRATKWNLAQAISRVQGTIVWRREYGLEKFTPEYISPENETGKQVMFGYDINGRPCLYLNPALQNTARTERNIQHLVFMLEGCITLMAPHVETMAILCNMGQSASKHPSVGQGRAFLSILQSHYPERLGRALVMNVPWVVWGFFKLINPFIDPYTKEKMRFDEDMTKLVPKAQLLKEYGGDVVFEYRHEVYWDAFCGLVAERRKAMERRWEEGGKQVGESEVYLRGGDEASISKSGEDVAKEGA